jgi:hypothetical protein
MNNTKRKTRYMAGAVLGTVYMLVAADPAAGATITVNAGADLQAAINKALPGDTLLLAAGATFVGNFVLPVKSGTSYITIRSAAADSSLPGASTRIDSTFAAMLPKIQSPNSLAAMATAPGAHHYRLQCLEFLANAQGIGDVVQLGDGSSAQNTLASVPHDLVVDRVYIHGDPTSGQKRAIALNSAATTIVNSYIANIWAPGQDSQAIAGWNGPGPFTISNNYLEAAGENFLLGGADPSIPNLVPSNITFTQNHLSKQIAWEQRTGMSVKNLLELKNAQNITIDSNILEHCWLDAQTGFAVLFTPRNQGGTAPWSVVQHVRFTNNIVRHVSSGVNILGNDNDYPSQLTNDIVILNNLFYDVSSAYGGNGRFLMTGGGTNVTVDHNTVIQDGWTDVYAYGPPVTGFTFTNNILPDYSWAILGDNTTPGNNAIQTYYPGSTLLRNVIAGSDPSTYPTGNFYPATFTAVGFVDLAGGNYALSASSPYLHSATDGTAVGCDLTRLPALTPDAAVVAVDKTSLVFAAANNGAAFTSDSGTQTVRLTQSGIGSAAWTASSSAPWLVVSPASGTGPATLSVSVKFVPGLVSQQNSSIVLNFSGAANSAGPITVALTSRQSGTTLAPFGSFDTPGDGSTGVAGSIPVTGWALDDVEVTRLTICRDAVAGETAPTADPNCAGLLKKIYIGDAVFIDRARPDVQKLYPALPLNTRAGWGYLLLSNFLPNHGNGTFTLRAYAFDAEGHKIELGHKTITCANASSVAPFGALDRPAQGEVVSGAAYPNTGWVLSPGQAHADPPNGGIVHVFVDGTDLGPPNPGLWNARPDLTALFPQAQFAGINTALGINSLDTTKLANGVHTISWSVSGTSGGTSGVGSRYFNVSNSSNSLMATGAVTALRAAAVIASSPTLDVPDATLESEIAAAPVDLSPVQGRRGFDLERRLQPYTPSSGVIDVQAEELDRIELHLSSTPQGGYSGYLRTSAGLKPLPVGSSLDSTGTFTWMPGVGFYGAYDLTFVQWSGGQAANRRDVRITLNAKGSNRVGPQTVVDAPVSGAIVGASFFVGGWAADLDSSFDTGVNTVHVWAYPVDAHGTRLAPIFIGPATYGGGRPDVAAVYGDRFENAGYGILVNGLPVGTYDIAVFAYSTVRGSFTAASVARVTVR